MKQQLQTTSQGIDFFLNGLKRLPEPGIRAFVLIPLTINIVVFSLLIWLATKQFSHWVDAMVGWLPDWLSFLTFIVWPLFAVTILLGLFFGFTIVANLIAAPFNGFLAEKIQKELDPGCMPDGGWKELLALIPRTLVRELQKLWYYLPRALILLILSFIPGINLVTPFLWLFFSAWMMGVQYCDYGADNELVNFKVMLNRLANPRMQTVAFGGIVSLFTMIPLINLIVMPAAVIGGTELWVRRRGLSSKVNKS
ncbi:sulfate transporter CysZ [Sansalvadorimonas sp. 2012CJ34-2]|uniref:Sulfate transporter CysZ n=1 Tax=Parendozoicomonas callyspongiae TaxID=2942213 RepID=A0ABT0PH82_9GAMM|nr:sulfate transporter CysZ [Sansalvadorimonas sp. 2012CJ34-2]MCL6270685.1 sulfate transporter CysZ [Sansalvadorimonas sp. 2012CJ34-2]